MFLIYVLSLKMIIHNTNDVISELSPSLSLYRTSVQSIQHCKECVGCATAHGLWA